MATATMEFPVSEFGILELPEFEWIEPVQTLRDDGDNESGAAADGPQGAATTEADGGSGNLAGLDLPEFVWVDPVELVKERRREYVREAVVAAPVDCQITVLREQSPLDFLRGQIAAKVMQIEEYRSKMKSARKELRELVGDLRSEMDGEVDASDEEEDGDLSCNEHHVAVSASVAQDGSDSPLVRFSGSPVPARPDADIAELKSTKFGLSAGREERLRESGMETICQVEDCIAGKNPRFPHGLFKLQGFGKKAVDAVTDAVVEWRTAHPIFENVPLPHEGWTQENYKAYREFQNEMGSAFGLDELESPASPPVAAIEPTTKPPEPVAEPPQAPIELMPATSPAAVAVAAMNEAAKPKRQRKPKAAAVEVGESAVEKIEPLPGQQELPLPEVPAAEAVTSRKPIAHPACTSTTSPSGIALNDPDARKAWMEQAALEAYPDRLDDPEIGSQSRQRGWFVAGCTCALGNRPVTANPFKRGSECWVCWDKGWQAIAAAPGGCVECESEVSNVAS